MAVLDTSFLIALERGDRGAWLRLEGLQASPGLLRVPAAVWIEYLAPKTPAKRARAVEELDDAVVFEPLTREVADAAARLQHELRSAGTLLSWHDLQVAATALHYNEAVVTSGRGFVKVPGLHVVEI